MTAVYRVQDDEGRGPWRPGFSRQWIDAASTRPLPPAFFEELRLKPDEVIALFRPHEHGGIGCLELEQLWQQWFTPLERARLEGFGYSVVRLEMDRLIATTPHQVVFAQRRPLHVGAVILPWPPSLIL